MTRRPNSRLSGLHADSNSSLPGLMTDKVGPLKAQPLDMVSNSESLMSQMLEDRINDSLIKMKQKNIKSLANLGNFYSKSSSVMKERGKARLRSPRKNWVPAKTTSPNKSNNNRKSSPTKVSNRLTNSIDKFKTLEEQIKNMGSKKHKMSKRTKSTIY